MKKLTLLATACIIASASAAQAVDAPSLGNRLMQNWNDNTARQSWNDPVKSEPAFPAAGTEQVKGDEGMMHGKHHGKHHHGAKKAEKKTAAAKATPEDKAKMKAERKAKWDAMTPEQKAAWKAKHAKKAAVTTSTPAAK